MPEEPVYEAALQCLREGWLSMGPRTQRLEAAWAHWAGCRHALALSSGTAALHLALRALGVGEGEDVLVDGHASIGAGVAPLHAGARTVFYRTPGTSAAIVVGDDHVLGVPNVSYRRTPLEPGGARPAVACWSLRELVGEGGMLATDDEEIAAAVKALRSHAMTSGTWDRHRGHHDSYDIVGLGFNFRMDEPRAALALAHLERGLKALPERPAPAHPLHSLSLFRSG